MRLQAALIGDLNKIMKQELSDAEKAVSSGMREATDGLKNAMRAQVASAGLGQKLEKSWRGDVYPKGKDSVNAAGHVYTKAAKIMEGFEKATVIRSPDGWWLAIPSENAPKRGNGGKRITPSNFPEAQLGKLRFVYRSGKPSLLVVDNSRASYNRKTGRLRGFKKASDKALTKGHGLTTVVMFFLVPSVSIPKKISFWVQVESWHGKLADLIMKNWPNHSDNS